MSLPAVDDRKGSRQPRVRNDARRGHPVRAPRVPRAVCDAKIRRKAWRPSSRSGRRSSRTGKNRRTRLYFRTQITRTTDGLRASRRSRPRSRCTFCASRKARTARPGVSALRCDGRACGHGCDFSAVDPGELALRIERRGAVETRLRRRLERQRVGQRRAFAALTALPPPCACGSATPSSVTSVPLGAPAPSKPPASDSRAIERAAAPDRRSCPPQHDPHRQCPRTASRAAFERLRLGDEWPPVLTTTPLAYSTLRRGGGRDRRPVRNGRNALDIATTIGSIVPSSPDRREW